MQLIWATDKHGALPCTYRGIADDGRVIIRLKDPYDPGLVELKVPRTEVQRLEQEQTKTDEVVES